jgi:hypothetical protein
VGAVEDIPSAEENFTASASYEVGLTRHTIERGVDRGIPDYIPDGGTIHVSLGTGGAGGMFFSDVTWNILLREARVDHEGASYVYRLRDPTKVVEVTRWLDRGEHLTRTFGEEEGQFNNKYNGDGILRADHDVVGRAALIPMHGDLLLGLCAQYDMEPYRYPRLTSMFDFLRSSCEFGYDDDYHVVHREHIPMTWFMRVALGAGSAMDQIAASSRLFHKLFTPGLCMLRVSGERGSPEVLVNIIYPVISSGTLADPVPLSLAFPAVFTDDERPEVKVLKEATIPSNLNNNKLGLWRGSYSTALTVSGFVPAGTVEEVYEGFQNWLLRGKKPRVGLMYQSNVGLLSMYGGRRADGSIVSVISRRSRGSSGWNENNLGLKALSHKIKSYHDVSETRIDYGQPHSAMTLLSVGGGFMEWL